jgi:rhodanese-related sulfurtransferase
MTSGIDGRLADARTRINRVRPPEAADVVADGGVLIDIRPAAQRRRYGEFLDAVVIERNVLEWRLDPSGADHLDIITSVDQPVVIACQEGYASSLAVESLRQIGLNDVSDLDGGFRAWQEAGLPVKAPWPKTVPSPDHG